LILLLIKYLFKNYSIIKSLRLLIESNINIETNKINVTWQSFKQGDRGAFEQLLNQHYDFLLNYGVRFYNDKEFVQDCVHDLFVDLWNRREHLSDVVSVKAYLFKILRRNITKENKRLKWFRNADSILEEGNNFEVEFSIESYLIGREIQAESLQRLQIALSKLTKRQREALFLRFSENLSYDEIAEIMGINYRSGVNLIHEAIKAIRQNWFMFLGTGFIFFLSFFSTSVSALSLSYYKILNFF
jgi:RNA polymerase sigma factor (sigma-70 family)